MPASARAIGMNALVLAACLAAWTVVLQPTSRLLWPMLCGGTVDATVQATLLLNPPVFILGAWAAMVVAMMSPVLLATARRRVVEASLAEVALFLTAYGAGWMVAGAGLFAVALLAASAKLSPAGALMLGMAAVGLWQASPARQQCLNLCHRIGARRATAGTTGGAFAAGSAYAAGCVGATWPLMLAALAAPDWHLAAMLIATAWMVSDRLEPPSRPTWRWRWPGRGAWRAMARA